MVAGVKKNGAPKLNTFVYPDEGHGFQKRKSNYYLKKQL
jgi:hypothetical protein